MGRAFADITFTPSVKAAQSRYGSRQANAAFEHAAARNDALGEAEAAFIAQMDGFFLASTGEGGWPYVQFRGGPPGFLRVLDAATLGFADFRGNTQYLSVGNLAADGRVMLLLLNQSQPSRLKLWGTARVVDRRDDPQLVESLQVAGYAARVERAVVITVSAFDWNCPQHITPRFTEAEIREMTAPLAAEIQALRQRVVAPPARRVRTTALGRGPLRLVVAGLRQLTPRVRAYLLKPDDGGPLPAVEPGAHLALPIRAADGRDDVRHYSIASDTDDPTQWEVAVLSEERGLGGSAFIHANYALGFVLHASLPSNGFELHEDDRPAVLIAGGIGIAPLRAMALALDRDRRAFQLHYAGRSAADAAYLAELRRELPGRLQTHWSDLGASARLDLQAVVDAVPRDAVFYVCGPERLLGAFRAVAQQAALADDRVRLERFSAPPARSDDPPFTVRLERSGRLLDVPPDRTLLDVLLAAGMPVPYDCKVGTCGTCAVKVLQGRPDHRDVVLAQSEREQGHLMCTCVSRSAGGPLVLDL